MVENWFLRGSAKIELKISCEDFYTLLLLNHHSPPTPPPPTPNTYSYLILKILNFWLLENVIKSTEVKYEILQIKIAY